MTTIPNVFIDSAPFDGAVAEPAIATVRVPDAQLHRLREVLADVAAGHLNPTQPDSARHLDFLVACAYFGQA